MNVVTALILFDVAHQLMATIAALKIRTHHVLFNWLVESRGVGQRLASCTCGIVARDLTSRDQDKEPSDLF